jgi:hypothetical protein
VAVGVGVTASATITTKVVALARSPLFSPLRFTLLPAPKIVAGTAALGAVHEKSQPAMLSVLRFGAVCVSSPASSCSP